MKAIDDTIARSSARVTLEPTRLCRSDAGGGTIVVGGTRNDRREAFRRGEGGDASTYGLLQSKWGY